MRLSELFNFRRTVSVSRDQLAEVVAPLMDNKQSRSGGAIAHGWDETAEWLRIGFDAEKEKGSLYHALHFALRQVAGTIRSAPDQATHIEIRRDDLEALKSASIQLTQAAYELEALAKRKENYQQTFVQDRHGNMIALPFTAIYNRPDAPHDIMAMKLEEIAGRMDKFLTALNIRPMHDRALNSYYPDPKLFR